MQIVENIRLEGEIRKWQKRGNSRTIHYVRNTQKKLVVDTSAMHDKEPFKVIERYSKVILLEGVIDELDEKRNTIKNTHARKNMCRLLDLNAKDPKSVKFETVQEEKVASYVDDNILEYCCTHPNTVLFTCDKGLASRAKLYKIPYILGHSVAEKKNKRIDTSSQMVTTLNGVLPRGKGKIGLQFFDKTTHIGFVWDKDGNKKVAIADIYPIQKGDHVLFSKVVGRRLTVEEYEITKEHVKDQARLLERWRISQEEEIDMHEHLPVFVKAGLKIQFASIKRL